MKKYLVILCKDYDYDTKGIIFAENGLQARVFFKRMLMNEYKDNFYVTLDLNEFDVYNLDEIAENEILV